MGDGKAKIAQLREQVDTLGDAPLMTPRVAFTD